MIALTIFPFTAAKYMLKNVLRTRKTVSSDKSKTSVHFHVGITILSNFLILERKTASTLPFPAYHEGKYYFFLVGILNFEFKFFNRAFLVANMDKKQNNKDDGGRY